MQSVELPKFLSIKDCANMLQMSYKGMWSIVASGYGPPHVKIRKTVRIAEDEFHKWVNSNRRG